MGPHGSREMAARRALLVIGMMMLLLTPATPWLALGPLGLHFQRAGQSVPGVGWADLTPGCSASARKSSTPDATGLHRAFALMSLNGRRARGTQCNWKSSDTCRSSPVRIGMTALCMMDPADGLGAGRRNENEESQRRGGSQSKTSSIRRAVETNTESASSTLLGCKADSGVASQPVVSSRRTGKRRFSARVPSNFSQPFKAIKETVSSGKQPPLLSFMLLLKKISISATTGYEWPTMQHGREIFKLLNDAEMMPDTACFRFYIRLAAKRAWKGEVSREELWGILSSARSCRPAVELDVDMYNSLLECAAGIAHATAANRTSHSGSTRVGLKDGWRLIEECKRDGLAPDLVTWSGVLDLAVGLARQRRIKGPEVQQVVETMRSEGAFGDPDKASRIYNRWVLELQDIMRVADPGNPWGGSVTWFQFRGEMKERGFSPADLGFLWEERKRRIRAFEQKMARIDRKRARGVLL